MTLTQITLQSLPVDQRRAALASLAQYDREIRRRLWARRGKAAVELVGAIIATVGFVALMWAFAALTPAQRSAEADLAAAEMEVR